MKQGWAIEDVEKAPYHYLLHLYSEVDEKHKVMDPEDFFRRILPPEEIKKLDQLNKEKEEQNKTGE